MASERLGLVGIMDRLEVHERIVDTEFFWHGGVLDVPKVYDADGHYHTDRSGKGQRHVPERPDGEELGVAQTFDRSADREWLLPLLSSL